ncbi:hypothetical protein PAXRUDRAFT_244575 [Paxillus rubicundulus Ve08.2h10]|uniref:Uncharacterized protein n=1 Tax=Paxillus rubicundulus Ve08.2h10 TaxID=930991 RepID=A0A0D0EB70_9AGAM|nr:hypothetical protein PAXRUDRAFT_244575 [Paxillus rubicundulus Ve08.2h10]
MDRMLTRHARASTVGSVGRLHSHCAQSHSCMCGYSACRVGRHLQVSIPESRGLTLRISSEQGQVRLHSSSFVSEVVGGLTAVTCQCCHSAPPGSW